MGQVMKMPRIIRGAILKFVDGRWSCEGQAVPLGKQLFVAGMTRCLQRWQDGELVGQEEEKPDTPLADPDELNEKIAETEWEEDLAGNPRPPWARYFVAYLVSPDDASEFTTINCTTGMRIAWERLHDRIDRMRWMKGADVVPLIALQALPMKTSFGEKQRPEFAVVDWREIGGGQTVLPPPTTPPALPNNSAADVSAKDAEREPAKPKKSVKKQPVPGKPVKPPTLKEELNDEIGF